MICPCRTYLGMRQAKAEFSDVAPGLVASDPALRAGPLWLPNGLGITSGARRAPAGCGT